MLVDNSFVAKTLLHLQEHCSVVDVLEEALIEGKK
jgi:hypothetical protein